MIEKIIQAISNLVNRLPDTYKKDNESNTAKLLKTFEEELEEIKNELEGLEDLIDIDRATGWRLDIIGSNFNVRRRGLSDADYRYLIKLQIISNMSPGDIATLNQVGQFFLGDSYIRLQETWQDEPASFQVIYDYMQLFDKVMAEHEDGTIDDIRTTIELALDSLQRTRGAGINLILVPIIDSFDHDVSRAEGLLKTILKEAIKAEEIYRMESVQKDIKKDLAVSETNSLLDGGSNLDGSLSLNGYRPLVKNSLEIEVAS